MKASHIYQRKRRERISTSGIFFEKFKEQLVNLENEKGRIESELSKINGQISTIQHKLIPSYAHVGYWKCDKSPLKVCVYKDDDYEEDFCIYCNKPDERK